MLDKYPDFSNKVYDKEKGKLIPFSDSIENNLSLKDKTILKKFLFYCGTTSGEGKVKERRRDILQVKYIIEKDFDKWGIDELTHFCYLLNNTDKRGWSKTCILISLKMFIKWYFEDWSSRFKNLVVIDKTRKGIDRTNRDIYNESTFIDLETDIEKMFRCCINLRDKCYLMLLSESGLPPKVLRTLKWKNIKFENYGDKEFGIIDYFRTKNKGDFTSIVFNSLIHIKRWKNDYSYPERTDEDWVFPSPRDRTKHISQQQIWYMIKQISKKSGIKKNVFQYLIRHQVLSENYEILPEEIHRKVFGHKEGSNQTKTYSHISRKKSINKMIELKYNIKEPKVKNVKKLENRIEYLENKFKKMDSLMIKMFNERMKEKGIITIEKVK